MEHFSEDLESANCRGRPVSPNCSVRLFVLKPLWGSSSSDQGTDLAQFQVLRVSPAVFKPCCSIKGLLSSLPDPQKPALVFVGSSAWSRVWSPEALSKDFNRRDAPKVRALPSSLKDKQGVDSYRVSLQMSALCATTCALSHPRPFHMSIPRARALRRQAWAPSAKGASANIAS